MYVIIVFKEQNYNLVENGPSLRIGFCVLFYVLLGALKYIAGAVAS